MSQVYAERLKLAKPEDHVVLPEVISKEPLATVVRHGDDQWLDIIKWTHYAMLNAEELGITQKNVDEMLKSDKPEIKRLLGTDGNLGEQLGLTKDWVVRIVKAVGNYGEFVRPQCRSRLEAEHLARPQPPVEPGRHPVRTAGALSGQGRQAGAPDRWQLNRESRRVTLALHLRRALGGRAGWGGFAAQLAFVAFVIWLGYEIYSNAQANLQAQRIATGFGFHAEHRRLRRQPNA